jgi:RNA polymerase sigma-32 factor
MESRLNTEYTVPGSDRIYFSSVGKLGLLTPGEELIVARRFKAHARKQDLRILAESNLRFVIKVAQEYRNYGFPMMDLIQEGNIGLIKAIERFDPEKGFRLISYGVWWIRAAIQEFILKNWSLVKIGTTQLQRRLFNNLQSSQRRIAKLTDIDAFDQETRKLAEQMGGTVDEIRELLARFTARDSSLDAPVHLGDDGSHTLMDRLASHPGDEAVDEALARTEVEELRRTLLGSAMGRLNERDRHILDQRHLRDEPLTLRELGEQLGVSKERVRQLESRAVEEVRKSLTRNQQFQSL